MTGSRVKPTTAGSRPAPLANGPWGSLKQLLDRLLVVNVFLVMPAVGLLMAAALLSGILGWWQRRGQP